MFNILKISHPVKPRKPPTGQEVPKIKNLGTVQAVQSAKLTACLYKGWEYLFYTTPSQNLPVCFLKLGIRSGLFTTPIYLGGEQHKIKALPEKTELNRF